jgi:hypothetical protein
MFEKFKRRSKSQQTPTLQIPKDPEQEKIKDEPKEKLIENEPKTTQSVDKPEHKIEEESKIEEKTEITYSKMQTSKRAESEFIAIKVYSSFLQLSEMIEKEISQTKSKLGKYLLQIDKKKNLAEKSRNIRTTVFKLADKKQVKEDQNEFEINGLQIVLDATPRHEIEALESVAKSQQDRLHYLQKTRTALKELDKLGEVQEVGFFVVEKYGVPEKILLNVP